MVNSDNNGFDYKHRRMRIGYRAGGRTWPVGVWVRKIPMTKNSKKTFNHSGISIRVTMRISHECKATKRNCHKKIITMILLPILQVTVSEFIEWTRHIIGITEKFLDKEEVKSGRYSSVSEVIKKCITNAREWRKEMKVFKMLGRWDWAWGFWSQSALKVTSKTSYEISVTN